LLVERVLMVGGLGSGLGEVAVDGGAGDVCGEMLTHENDFLARCTPRLAADLAARNPALSRHARQCLQRVGLPGLPQATRP
jgi:hypothetical protein